MIICPKCDSVMSKVTEGHECGNCGFTLTRGDSNETHAREVHHHRQNSLDFYSDNALDEHAGIGLGIGCLYPAMSGEDD